jgi:hypothetical protein
MPGASPCSSELWPLIDETLEELCQAYNSGRLVPILEADVEGFAYHLLVTKLRGDASRVHLGTRVVGGRENAQYDMAIGRVVSTEEQKQGLLKHAGDQMDARMRKLLTSKALLSGFRPAVAAEIVLEFKLFAVGFDAVQLREHWVQALEDIEKLAALKDVCPDGRAAVLFDDHGYLTAARRDAIVARRSGDDHDMRIYVFERTDERSIAVKAM